MSYRQEKFSIAGFDNNIYYLLIYSCLPLRVIRYASGWNRSAFITKKQKNDLRGMILIISQGILLNVQKIRALRSRVVLALFLNNFDVPARRPQSTLTHTRAVLK